MDETQGPRAMGMRLAVWRLTRPARAESRGEALQRRTTDVPAGLFWGLPR